MNTARTIPNSTTVLKTQADEFMGSTSPHKLWLYSKDVYNYFVKSCQCQESKTIFLNKWIFSRKSPSKIHGYIRTLQWQCMSTYGNKTNRRMKP